MEQVDLTEESRLFRDSFRRFVAREITPNVKAWEAAGGLPRALWRHMGQEGFLCPWLPAEYGGLGLGYEFSVIINEELVRGEAFGAGISLHSDVAARYIFHYATPSVKARWLPACAQGEAVTCLALTEPGAGSDLSAMITTARRDGDVFLVGGSKTFITNGGSADLVILAAKTDPNSEFFGISLLLVEAERAGFHRGANLKKMGCHLMDTAELFFDDCRVPAENLLGREGFGARYILERLPEERLEVAVKCQTLAEEIFKETLNYTKTRRAFGRAIGNFQANAFKLAEMATEVEFGRSFLNSLLTDYRNDLDVNQRILMAKFWLAEMVNRLAFQAVQLHGGYGYMEEFRVCRMARDARVATIYAGTSEIMKLLISRNLGLRPI